jgi:hypothetical protein
MARIIEDLAGDWRRLDERVKNLSDEIEAIARQDAGCERLMSVPGIGPIISSAMVAAIGAGDVFTKGRDFAAWLGLVPKQISTGDRTILGKISRRGNRYLRVLFVQAAWVVLIKPKIWERHGLKPWIEAARKRLHHNVLAIALANKLARIALERPGPPGLRGAEDRSGRERLIPIPRQRQQRPENEELRDSASCTSRIRFPTGTGRLSMKVWKVSSASQWWRPASIIPIRRARRRQRKAYSQNSPAGCATSAVTSPAASSVMPRCRNWRVRRLSQRPATPKGGRQSRFRNMRAMRLRRASIRTAAPLLREILSMITFSISRPSCAARPAERRAPAV